MKNILTFEDYVPQDLYIDIVKYDFKTFVAFSMLSKSIRKYLKRYDRIELFMRIKCSPNKRCDIFKLYHEIDVSFWHNDNIYFKTKEIFHSEKYIPSYVSLTNTSMIDYIGNVYLTHNEITRGNLYFSYDKNGKTIDSINFDIKYDTRQTFFVFDNELQFYHKIIDNRRIKNNYINTIQKFIKGIIKIDELCGMKFIIDPEICPNIYKIYNDIILKRKLKK